ncbi:hypothetical protein QZH41_012595, partial [Actinostola sp. cb2023]
TESVPVNKVVPRVVKYLDKTHCCEGFTGKHCDQKLLDALCDPECLNGGTCIGQDKCACSNGWQGSSCEIATCEPPCKHGGMCVSPGMCACTDDHSGERCEKELCIFCFVARALTIPNKKNGHCSSWGQTHYRTFDGLHLDFVGKCSYALAKDCVPGSDQFSIHLENDVNCADSKGLGCKRAVLMYIGEQVYKVSTGDVIKVDNKRIAVPYKDARVSISKVLNYVIMRAWGDDIEVKFDGVSGIYVSLADKYKNNTCGLCGNYNDMPDDDITKSTSNHQASNTAELADSWAMPNPKETCQPAQLLSMDVCKNAGSSVRLSAKRMCLVLLGEHFSACHSKVHPKGFIERCEIDVCSCNFGKHSGCQCEALTQYSRVCASKGITLDWRNDYLCPKKCSKSKVYSECGPACVKTCDTDALQPTCRETCVDGCHCPVGSVHGQQSDCLQQSQCPCRHNDVDYPSGKSIRLGCNTCDCNGGTWTCTKNRCPGTCYTYGDPHYVTFDGKAYSFEGKCQYRLVESRDSYFSVVINTASCLSNQRSSCVKSAVINYNNVSISLVHDHPLKDTVHIQYPGQSNDQPALMPVYDTIRGFVFRRLSSNVVEFQGDNGLAVSWDGQTNLYVTLTPRHAGKVQGLCGNFNFNTKDDFGVEESAVSFGNTWSEENCPDVANNKMKLKPSIRCPSGMEYKECGSSCVTSCKDLSIKKHSCVEHCVPGCRCPSGKLYDTREGKCVAIAYCPCYDDAGRHYMYNARTKIKCNDWLVICSRGMFVCTNNICKENQCPRGQVWTKCGAQCPRTCKNMHMGCSSIVCKAGCVCPQGFVEENGTCILATTCPCHYNGKSYKTSDVIKRDCNT